MNSNKSLYKCRASGILHGDVFTRHEVVVYMLDALNYISDRNLSDIKILEPSCGNGEFVVEILMRLKASSIRYGFDFNASFHNNILACDIDPLKVAHCIQRIHLAFPMLQNVEANVLCEDFLLSSHGCFDMVVGNPPYIRYEEIPLCKRDVYKTTFTTFYYRADIYVLFFEKTIRMLKPKGRHCFICSNRWMKNQYGKKLRQLIASQMKICRIIDMEQADAFYESVLAYPAITLFQNSLPDSTFDYARVRSIASLDNFVCSVRTAPYNEDWSCAFLNGQMLGNMMPIEQQGFKIGVGVATGADSIFVSTELYDMVEHELLIPALNARNLSGDNFVWDNRYLLNPYTKDGTLICLDDYPLAKAYLEFHYERLSNRHKCLKNPSRWYATIDLIKPALQKEVKILLPDMSGNRFVFIDKGYYYPQHNLYYIIGKGERALRLLAAILMSDVIKLQLYEMSNRMNGGYPRWQSQYLRKLLVPNISLISTDVADSLLYAYEQHDILAVNSIVNSFVLSKSHSSKQCNMKARQLQFAFDN